MAYRLLLADDSITIQKVVELVLAEEDCEIKSVSNGEDAYRLIESFRPDIVLADIEMPKMNGYQLCEKIKQNPDSAGIPVILLAGAFEPMDDELAQRVGADDSVIKPFESHELISKINSVLAVAAAAGGGDEIVAGEALEEEALEFAEEAEEGVAVEAGELGADEDLWTLEEIGEIPAEFGAESGLEEELTEAETAFELPEEEISAAPAPEEAVMTEAAEEVIRKKEIEVEKAEMPSREELVKLFEKSIHDQVGAVISSMDIRDSLMSQLAPSIKDSVEKILWEVAPDMVEKMLREVLKDSIASIAKEVEKVIWETVPELASTMISKEIEKIKAEF